MRQRLRPCCAFGADLGARVGRIPVLAYRIGNVQSREDVGPHTYDSGVLRIRRAEQEAVLLNNERNGQVYTCRGGFIDTAHVRDYADWGLYLGAAFARTVEKGARIQLPDEGGSRVVVFEPPPSELVERYGLMRVTGAVGEWIAFQLGVWHEIATWYGWASVRGFSERASAFSPEDLYSNLLGIKLARAVGQRRQANSEGLYNAAITGWIDASLRKLGAVPKDVGRQATAAVDGLWWDSRTRLPDPRLVLRRSFEFEDPVQPWLVPPSRMSAELASALERHCGSADPEPLPLPLGRAAEPALLGRMARLELVVDDRLAAQEPFAQMGREVTDRDFPEIIRVIREQNRAEFGERADLPD